MFVNVPIVIAALIAFAGSLFMSNPDAITFGAPTDTFQKNLIPLTDSTYTLGTTTKAWLNLYIDEICLDGTCRTSWPAGGVGGSGSVSTSTNETAGTLSYWTSNSATPALLGKVSTTTASCSGSASCTPFTVIGASPVTISATGGSGGSGSVSTSSPGVVSSLAYFTTAGATPELVSPVATTTLTASTPLSLSNPVAKVGGSNSILTLDTSGTWSGNAGTASALFANGSNCSAGQAAGGVTAAGVAEDCTDYWTEAENTSAAYLNLTSLSAISKGFFFSTTSADAWKNTNNFFSTTSANFYTATGLAWSTTSANAWKGTQNFWATTSADFYTAAGLSWSTTSANAWQNTRNFFSTTSADAWKNTNNFFSTTSDNYYTSVGLSWSTTSANAWQNTRNFWATSSANYFTSAGLSWSTTSADAWKNVNNFFSTTSANYFTSVGLSWSTTSADSWKTISGLLTAPDINNRVATSVVPTLGQLAYWTGIGTPSTVGSVATTTASCSGTVSCTSFTVIGSSPITLTGSGGAGSNFPQWATTSPYSGQLVMYPNDQDNTDVVFGRGNGATSSAPFWFDVSATTTYIGNGGTGSSTIQVGPSGFEWLFGFDGSDNSFKISSSTVTTGFSTSNVLSIAKSTLLATFKAAVTIVGNLTLSANLIFDGETFDSLTDDATLANNGGDLQVVDLTCTDCINDTEISTNAGTALSADLEEEVTTGSLADGVINEPDLDVDDAPSDGDILTYDTTGTNFVWETILALVNTITGAVDWGGITSFEIPNGTAPVVDAIGEIALDTTANQLLIATSTNASFPAVIPLEEVLFSVPVGSTTPEFISSGRIPIPKFLDQGREITRIVCTVDGGTSKVINVTDGTNDTETVTCGTTATADNSIDTNATFTANELWYLEFGATTGSVNYVSVTAYGRLDRQ